MRKLYCDICGVEIGGIGSDDVSNKKKFLNAHLQGIFDVTYHIPVVNKEGEVLHFHPDYDFNICPCCNDSIENAIWARVMKIREDFGVNKVLPIFPKEPDTLMEPASPTEVFTDG